MKSNTAAMLSPNDLTTTSFSLETGESAKAYSAIHNYSSPFAACKPVICYSCSCMMCLLYWTGKNA